MLLHPEKLIHKIGFGAIRQATVGYARSTMGEKRIQAILPSSDRSVIEQKLSLTREMMVMLQHEAAFPLYNLHDIREYLEKSKAEGSLLAGDALIQISEVAASARNLKNFIKAREENYPALKEASIAFIPLKELEEEINKVLTEQGELKNDASPQLSSIRNKINKKRSNLRTTINNVMSRATEKGMASDEGPTLRNGRMVIPIQAEFKRKVKGFIHDVSSSGQTVYLEPVEALNINNEIRRLESEEKREIERILRELTNHVRRNREELSQNQTTLIRFDVITAKAELSINLEGYIPVLSEKKRLYIKEAYNPILKLKNLDQKEEIVPLDLELTPEERCLVITGPNAGGKSVAMKTLGLCVMMLQSGFAIPARDSSELPVYESLFVDMGDDQSIENDLSTFSSRLEWMKEVLRKAGGNSLILIDEAAAGTDPEEGGALFQALIELLTEKEARVLVTTHHGSLKTFAHDHPKSVNGSMEFDQKTLSPTYRFKKGVPGSSYAFEIAQRMHLDEQLLSRARTLLGDSKENMETLIAELEAKTQEAEELKRKYDRLKTETETARHRYEEKRSSIDKEKERIREKALKEAKEIMNSANKKIEQAVEQIVQQGEKDKKTIKQARDKVEEHNQQVKDELRKLEQKKKQRKQVSEDPPKKGDEVRLEDANTTGELVEIQGEKAVVRAGGLRLKTDYKNLVKVKRPAGRKKKQQVKVNFEDGARYKRVKPQLSIRGMRGEEAMKEVEYYLDNAIAAGRPQVQIIHGKGEGILKKMVHEYLEQREEVSDFEIAPLELGGAGCTIVRL